MIRSVRIARFSKHALIGIAFVLMAGGCFRIDPILVSFPFNVNIDLGEFEGPMTFTIDAGSGHTFDVGSAPAGLPFPTQPTNQMFLTGFPTEEDIDDLVNGEVEGLTLTDVELTEVTLVRVSLTATEGDFSTINSVEVFYVPKDVNGVAQDPVSVGSAVAATGFGTKITLIPRNPVDFLSLVQANDANPAAGDPTAYCGVSGTVPETAPTWDTQVEVSASGHVALETDPIEFCEFPSTAEIDQMLVDAAGELVAGFAKVTELELVDIVLTATQNDFSDFQTIRLFYIPKPVDGVEQGAIEIGAASAAEGFGDTVVLEAAEDIDILELINNNEDNPSEECPQAYLVVEGDLPEALPVWNTEVNLLVHVTVGLFV